MKRATYYSETNRNENGGETEILTNFAASFGFIPRSLYSLLGTPQRSCTLTGTFQKHRSRSAVDNAVTAIVYIPMGRPQTTFLLLLLLTTLSKVSVAQTDAKILLQAEDWAAAFGWNESSNMCSNWTGVTCGANNRVTDL